MAMSGYPKKIRNPSIAGAMKKKTVRRRFARRFPARTLAGADGEPVVPRPQPAPSLEVARRLVEEVLDARSGPRLLAQDVTPPAGR